MNRWTPEPRSCPTCSVPIDGRKTFCSDDCRPDCAADGCTRKTIGKQDHCDTHYNKLRVKGSPKCLGCGTAIDWRRSYCSDECRPVCEYAACSRKTYGRKQFCMAHWEQWFHLGDVKDLAWAEEWKCIVCGADVEKGSRRRRHCSGRCQAISSRAPERPTSYNCVRCGIEVSLIERSTKSGQMKRSDSKLCKRCRWKTRTGMSVGEVAKRDGTQCKICGDEVDLNADPTDPFRGSVDHIIPRSLGGSNDPENLQLSHLWCNQVKSNRVDFSLMREAVNNVGN